MHQIFRKRKKISSIINRITRGEKPCKEKKRYGKQKFKATSVIISNVFIKKALTEFLFKAAKTQDF